MNMKELKETLENEKIPGELYSLKGGFPNESYCINKLNNNWEVYYSERGRKSDVKIFDIEEEACQHFYKRIMQML